MSEPRYKATVRWPGGERQLAVTGERARLPLTTLLREAGLPLNTRCGGRGLCDGCLVQLARGALVESHEGQLATPGEQSAVTVRACQHLLSGEAQTTLHLPARSLLSAQPQVVSNFRLNVPRAHDPLWQRVTLPRTALPPAERCDAQTICRALDARRAGHLPVRCDPDWHGVIELDHQSDVPLICQYRGDHWAVTGAAEDAPTRPVGAAIDVGTTTVALLLIDLTRGRVLAKASDFNQQMHLGDNVLTRINRCMTDPDALRHMQSAIIDQTLAPLLGRALSQAKAAPEELVSLTFAGNTTMLHLLTGTDPSSMGVVPFTPAFLEHRVLRGRHLELHACNTSNGEADDRHSDSAAESTADAVPVSGNPGCDNTPPSEQSQAQSQEQAQAPSCVAERKPTAGAALNPSVHLLPGIAAYIGADLTAGLLATGMLYHDTTALLVDVGTNGEIILKHHDRLVGCATAAGPAFEGAQLSCGVRAGAGAISHVALDQTQKTCELDVIGDVTPIGVCGTAYLDFIAEARRVELLGPTGRFDDAAASHWPRIQQQNGARAFVLAAPDSADAAPVAITERDIATLLQAKAAIGAGIECLLSRLGLEQHEVETVYLAGGFGLHMRVASAIGVGLLPGFDTQQVRLMGNTALAGAYLTLLDAGALGELSTVRERVEVIELNQDPAFEMTFIDHLALT